MLVMDSYIICHDITEILLKVPLNTITLTPHYQPVVQIAFEAVFPTSICIFTHD